MKLATSIRIGNRQVPVPVNFIDQVVNFISPAKGGQRWKERARMAITGGYSGVDRSRRANQRGMVREMDADSAILPDLQALREESQHQCRNNAIAGGAIKTNVTKVVGTGLKVKSQIDRAVLGLDDAAADQWERQAERLFLLATDTREIDCERQLNFPLLQGLVFLKTLEDGDCFVNLPRFRRPGSPFLLKLQVVEAARVSNKENTPDTDTLIAGIQKDSHGACSMVHICNHHPGNWRTMPTNIAWQEVKAFANDGSPNILLLLDKVRPGQTRGVPYLAPVIELIKQLGRYTDAEVMAAVVSGMLTVFVTNESGSPDLGGVENNGSAVDTKGMELGYGTVLGGLPGDKVEVINPGRPNTAFDPFVMAILRQVGVALELPFELLVKHFTSSYSAARAALEEAFDYFMRRRQWLVTMFCQPVYEAVITEAVITGRLQAPGFLADPLIRRAWLGSQWTGDAQSQLDPLKEINAAAKRVELTISTLDEESRRLTGTPWEDKLPQILKERQILRQAGITITTMEQVLAADPVSTNPQDPEEQP